MRRNLELRASSRNRGDRNYCNRAIYFFFLITVKVELSNWLLHGPLYIAHSDVFGVVDSERGVRGKNRDSIRSSPFKNEAPNLALSPSTVRGTRMSSKGVIRDIGASGKHPLHQALLPQIRRGLPFGYFDTDLPCLVLAPPCFYYIDRHRGAVSI